MSKGEVHVVPIHQQNPDVWALSGQPQPDVFLGVLRWIMEDDSRLESAIKSMQWIPVGLHMITIAAERSRGRVTRSLQLNLYSEDHPGNDGAHAHAKDAATSWYAPPGTYQHIRRERPLSPTTKRIHGLNLREVHAVANCLVDYGDAGRPGYRPVLLEQPRPILTQSTSAVAPLGYQTFASTEVHAIGFRGDGVAVSVHEKGAVEPDGLSDFDGLRDYKGLTVEEAEQVTAARLQLLRDLPKGAHLGPTTMLYANEAEARTIEPEPSRPSAAAAEKLLHGALRTAERLARCA